MAILESSARGASFLGRVTVGNLFPGAKKYFYRFDCGIYQAENWIRENIVTDPESYGFAKEVKEKTSASYGLDYQSNAKHTLGQKIHI